MHILQGTDVPIGQQDAVDLGQTPADILFLSMADSELCCLAQARAQRARQGMDMRVRVAHVGSLQHPLSVDTYVAKTARHARLIIVRLLGGRDYWRYGVERLAALHREHGVDVVFMSGTEHVDDTLRELSSVEGDVWERIWDYCRYGGVMNMENLLLYLQDRFLRHRQGARKTYPYGEAKPVPRAGLFRGGKTRVYGLSQWDKACVGDVRHPKIVILCYRALWLSADDAPIEALQEALTRHGFSSLAVFVASLRDGESSRMVDAVLGEVTPKALIDLTSFASRHEGGMDDCARWASLGFDGVVFQGMLASCSFDEWRKSTRGVPPRDVVMNVALPEMDGRLITRPLSFKDRVDFDDGVEAPLVKHAPVPDRIDFLCSLVKRFYVLATKRPHERRLALILAHYPHGDGRIGNGVGLDTPRSLWRLLHTLAQEGYDVRDIPEDSETLMRHIRSGVTSHWRTCESKDVECRLGAEAYGVIWNALPMSVREAIGARWGRMEDDPFFHEGERCFLLPVRRFGAVCVVVQPARGYHIDAASSYHDPALVPPHNYVAVYGWLARYDAVDGVIHLGKHGTLEWLPGKGVGLSSACYPEALFGAMPNVYPFIVNDPGEGIQAKRRAQATIIDHMTPPMARAGLYGFLSSLEALSEEYAHACALDPERLPALKREMVALAQRHGIDKDMGTEPSSQDFVASLDNHLCVIKESQIRDGLHVFGTAVEERAMASTLVALLRFPRGEGEGENSLLRALSEDMGFGDCDAFDPLSCALGAPYEGRHKEGEGEGEAGVQQGYRWRVQGDVVAFLEEEAHALLAGTKEAKASWHKTRAVLRYGESVRAILRRNGHAERLGLLRAIGGKSVAAGASGAPTKGRLDVFPMGRNFYAIDMRGMPSPSAYRLGKESAEQFFEDYCQRYGDPPQRVAMSVWATSNMRTYGHDIGQALALMGVEPWWDVGSQRVRGVKVIPLSVLGRQRVDVLLRVSGLFRDSFPHVMDLYASAVAQIADITDEGASDNPLRAWALRDERVWRSRGMGEAQAKAHARLRLFGSMPGAYGAGMQALIDEGGWHGDKDFADAFVAWGGYGYGGAFHGEDVAEVMRHCLTSVQAVLHNQDNSEHDILDSDDYYQFQGGMAATVRYLSGKQPHLYHHHYGNPYRKRVVPLQEEIGRVIRARAANPQWIKAMMRHGYKGAFELAATVDYLFAFAATARVVEDHHFDALYEAYLLDEDVVAFMRRANPHALQEMARRFREAQERGLWNSKRNDVGMV
ncbi:MAG: cobaltochelatase subunit CobN [Alphaproteobacteria bacterium GM7ARS4]|nr:cobaltochelatase subunit CobN [Alphaproteobacteria bacterium GM7ARS4]